MPGRRWQVAITGTFDVENYGDLLFPIIAEAELTERLGAVELHRLSYNAKTPPGWPYAVTSVSELPEVARGLDGMLIGGGSLIRFDKVIAPGYAPPTQAIHHPTGYWLTPALVALQHGVPLVWNSPGMHGDNIPAWAEPLMALALAGSRHVAVRDEMSRAVLARFVNKSRVAVLPDTGFGVSRLIDERHESAELRRLREAAGLSDPYVVVQAIGGLDPFLRLIKKHPRQFRDYRFLVLPIGPVLGDREDLIGDKLPATVRLPAWPHPLLMAELISRAAAVVGKSYHLMVTALACGVPAFCSADLSFWKYTALAGFKTLFPLPQASAADPQSLLARMGKGRPSAAALAALDELARHWDRVAAIISEGPVATPPALDRFWQSLPGLLETRNELFLSRAELAALRNSPSMRVTAPLRFLMRNLKRLVGK
ncbi:MAG TPA: polysaccharide pyruvyl transferase family protein [Blastocatellia bacterium]|nr:polysaccharide pyruvyl transferase family protein [Blastocatellia bacterium]